MGQGQRVEPCAREGWAGDMNIMAYLAIYSYEDGVRVVTVPRSNENIPPSLPYNWKKCWIDDEDGWLLIDVIRRGVDNWNRLRHTGGEA